MNGPVSEQSPALAALPGIKHGFFGRQEAGPAPFNLSENFGTKDAVAENRRQALAAIGMPEARLARLRQIHSSAVVTVSGGADFPDPPEADGLVTAMPGIALSILTADCVPVLFADSHAGIIGACHAGWRGAVGGIVGKTIAAMRALGARQENIVAAIGPAISGVNYEVGPDFAAMVQAAHAAASAFVFTPPGESRAHFDLPGFVESQLREAGIASAERVGGCTFANPERYFSHRYSTRHGAPAGRQISLIAIG